MTEIKNVEIEYRKVENESLKIIDDVKLKVETLKKKIEQDEDEAEKEVQKVYDEVEKILKSKKLYQIEDTLSKSMSKTEKIFNTYSKTTTVDAWDSTEFSEKQSIINQIIIQHLIRLGRFHTADTFSLESHTPIPDLLKSHFTQLLSVTSALDNFDFLPAINWILSLPQNARAHSDFSSLLFQLHKAHFLHTLNFDPKNDWKPHLGSALNYIRTCLVPFHSSFPLAFRQLSCALLFAPNLSDSPYPHLAPPVCTSPLKNAFSRLFCRSLFYSSDPPLLTTFVAGSFALPSFSKISSLLKKNPVPAFSSTSNLPNQPSVFPLTLDLPLFPSHTFHSVFSCPISKDPASSSNPPIMLACGHVICSSCVSFISKNVFPWIFKCPYCPLDSSSADALRLHI